MYNIINQEELSCAIKEKNDFELCRELSLWDIKKSDVDCGLIVQELYHRRGRIVIIEFFLVAMLTNVLQFFLESWFSYRWLLFEDTSRDIIRQYVTGFAFISIFPALILIVHLLNQGNYSLKGIVVIYGSVITIGLIKTFFDTFHFMKLL